MKRTARGLVAREAVTLAVLAVTQAVQVTAAVQAATVEHTEATVATAGCKLRSPRAQAGTLPRGSNNIPSAAPSPTAQRSRHHTTRCRGAARSMR